MQKYYPKYEDVFVTITGSDHLWEKLYPITKEHVNPSVEVHHLDGKLSTAETLLRCCNVMFQHDQVNIWWAR
jgi:hypothetical protein